MQKEVENFLAKEAQLQHKIEEMDSLNFELAEEVRDADLKKRDAHKHAKHFNQLTHRRLKRMKKMLKRSNDLGELNQKLKDEAGSLINALTSQ